MVVNTFINGLTSLLRNAYAWHMFIRTDQKEYQRGGHKWCSNQMVSAQSVQGRVFQNIFRIYKSKQDLCMFLRSIKGSLTVHWAFPQPQKKINAYQRSEGGPVQQEAGPTLLCWVEMLCTSLTRVCTDCLTSRNTLKDTQ